MERCHLPTYLLALSLLFSVVTKESYGDDRALADNRSIETLCAEHDNVNVPIFSPDAAATVVSFAIEARHPRYEYDVDLGDEDFTNCPPPTHADTFYSDPGEFLIHDDGTTAIVAVRIDRFWRPRAMTAIGMDARVDNIHYIAVHREVDGSYPQVLVYYSDGNLRLKPFPPLERSDVLFGSSIVVGPAPASDRPYVDVTSIEYRPQSDTFEILYTGGESAIISFEEISREATQIRVEPQFPSGQNVAFATFRSMYVHEGNTDVDRVEWEDGSGRVRVTPIMEFRRAVSDRFFFYREFWSKHNTSAPDIWIGGFEFAVETPGFIRGDANGDGSTNIADPIYVLNHLYGGGPGPSCQQTADANDDNAVNIGDPVYQLNHRFGGGPALAAPWDACGTDPTPAVSAEGDLSCAAYTACYEA